MADLRREPVPPLSEMEARIAAAVGEGLEELAEDLGEGLTRATLPGIRRQLRLALAVLDGIDCGVPA